MTNSVRIPPLLKLSKRCTLRAPTWDVAVISVEIWWEQKLLRTGVDVSDDGKGKKQKQNSIGIQYLFVFAKYLFMRETKQLKNHITSDFYILEYDVASCHIYINMMYFLYVFSLFVFVF